MYVWLNEWHTHTHTPLQPNIHRTQYNVGQSSGCFQLPKTYRVSHPTRVIRFRVTRCCSWAGRPWHPWFYIWRFLIRLCNGIIHWAYFAERYEFGCNFWDREGRTNTYTQNCTVKRFCACRGRKQSRDRHLIGSDRRIFQGPGPRRCKMLYIYICYTYYIYICYTYYIYMIYIYIYKYPIPRPTYVYRCRI